MSGAALPFPSSLNTDVMFGAVVILLGPRDNKPAAKDYKGELHLENRLDALS